MTKTKKIDKLIIGQKIKADLSRTQIFLLIILLGVGITLLGLTVQVQPFNTIILFVTVTSVGLWLCRQTYVDLCDPKLRILSTFWLCKIFITLFLLYFGWIPQLDPSSTGWGYDPQRYYIDALNLIENDWRPVAGSTYQGIIYYYGAIFYTLGHNPVIPALINIFLTLVSTLFLTRFVYLSVSERMAKDWTISVLMLVPEILWYDVMTSRETLMAAMIIFAILSIGKYVFDFQKKIILVNSLVLFITAFIFIMAVRTSMAFAVVGSIGVMVMLKNSERKSGSYSKILLIILVIALMLLGPFIQNILGGGEIDYLSTWESLQASGSTFVEDQNWSENSIGFLLYPRNIWQSLIFLPPRMVLYLLAPLPNINVGLIELIEGSWYSWQNLMAISTSILILCGMPFSLAASAKSWQLRKYNSAFLAVVIAFWITFIVVAGGNIIIHERYRIMITLLLFATVWFGYTRCSRYEINRWAKRWYILLATGAIFVIGYKF